MTRRVRCGYCPAAAVARLHGRATGTNTDTDTEDGDFRSVAVCQAHLPRARSWCAVAGPVAVEALPGGWVQLALDDTLPGSAG